MVTIFEQGDVVFIDFDPQAGHEQKGRRPALVVSNAAFNRFTRAAMVCPITNTDKGVPVRVRLDNRTKTTGVIMCEQVKALDLTKRHAVFVEKAPPNIVSEVVDMIYSFIEICN
jgi:mRNA interferase MazF